MELTAEFFDEFRSLVYAKSGITLGDGKEALVSARIGKRMRTLGMDDYHAYLDWVKGSGGADEMVQMLDAISTNVTSFFREPEHFDFLGKIISKWSELGQQRFRIWCAASSSGEEPYTIAMTIKECKLPAACDVRILATDISTRVLKAAEEGVYSSSKVASIPSALVSRYFKALRGTDGTDYEASAELKRMILYKRLNLAFPPFPMKGPMDVILCRNVMIYFDNPVRKRLIADFHRLLKPGGYLLVGHSESLNGLEADFKCVSPSVYLKGGK